MTSRSPWDLWELYIVPINIHIYTHYIYRPRPSRAFRVVPLLLSFRCFFFFVLLFCCCYCLKQCRLRSVLRSYFFRSPSLPPNSLGRTGAPKGGRNKKIKCPYPINVWTAAASRSCRPFLWSVCSSTVLRPRGLRTGPRKILENVVNYGTRRPLQRISITRHMVV